MLRFIPKTTLDEMGPHSTHSINIWGVLSELLKNAQLIPNDRHRLLFQHCTRESVPFCIGRSTGLFPWIPGIGDSIQQRRIVSKAQ
jgi:hypothetical protein